MTSKIIHSGRFFDLRNASAISKRFMLRARLGPVVSFDVASRLLVGGALPRHDYVLDALHALGQELIVDTDHDVGGEVDDLLERARRDIEQQAHRAGNTLEVPDVADRGSQLDMPHALAPDFGAGDLDAATIARDAPELDLAVLAAMTLPVPRRPENALAEEAVGFGLEGAVVDGLGLLHLAPGPASDLLGGGESETQLIESGGIYHGVPAPWFPKVLERIS